MGEDREELQLEENMIFQRREWKAERVVWVLMFLFVLAARQQGLMRLEQIRYAVLEKDGSISIIPEAHAK